MAFLAHIGIKFLVVTAVFALLILFVPKLRTSTPKVIFFAAPLLGLANITLGWLLGFIATVILILPIVLTLGLFGIVVPVIVNGFLIKVVDWKYEEFEVQGTGPLLGSAVVVSLAAFIVDRIFA
jgi:uncharacterized membrane protein YvlD (DUF360 family)